MIACAACEGGLPPGKVIFCPTCFFALPRKEQGQLHAHYIRVARATGGPVKANHPGMRDKVAKLSAMIREARGLTARPAGLVLVDASPRTSGMNQFRQEARQLCAVTNPPQP